MTTQFHADTVGSFLRPKSILEARGKNEKGEISNEALQKIEDEEIKKHVENQIKSGLKLVTDGEFRRDNFIYEFLIGFEGVEADLSFPSHGFENVKNLKKEETTTTSDSSFTPIFRHANVVGKVKYNPKHPLFRDFEFLNSVCPPGITPKLCIPTANYLLVFRDPAHLIPPAYNSLDEFIADVSEALKQTILHFYRLGARYIQIDEPIWLIYPVTIHEKEEDQFAALKWYIDFTVKVYSPFIKDLPKDLKLGWHTCRGNGSMSIHVPYTYDHIIDGLASLTPDFLLLEYDDQRSGDFTPLSRLATACPKAQLFLGLVSSKTSTVEAEALLEKRVEDASKYFPKERMGVCPQCGFGTFKEGNPATNEAAQWGKIEALTSVARKVWGNA